MANAPNSYRNQRRPPLGEALKLESGTLREVTQTLVRKGYFTPRPRPWQLGEHNRGLGRHTWAVLDYFGDVVAEKLERLDAELIIAAVNAYKPERKRKSRVK